MKACAWSTASWSQEVSVGMRIDVGTTQDNADPLAPNLIAQWPPDTRQSSGRCRLNGELHGGEQRPQCIQDLRIFHSHDAVRERATELERSLGGVGGCEAIGNRGALEPLGLSRLDAASHGVGARRLHAKYRALRLQDFHRGCAPGTKRAACHGNDQHIEASNLLGELNGDIGCAEDHPGAVKGMDNDAPLSLLDALHLRKRGMDVLDHEHIRAVTAADSKASRRNCAGYDDLGRDACGFGRRTPRRRHGYRRWP